MANATHAILAQQTVSITELRKNPAQFFIDEPVAVLSNNIPQGYMVNAELFEKLVNALEQQQRGFKASFRPASVRLEEIAEQGNQLLQEATDEEMKTFTE
ncbi:antitoxin YafN [Amphritea atlantica]|uniref:Antitoxin YafN n=1 Tax=Amphritea atlantica TaxID=355243 RepID=A0A1H9CKN4_9GAMM|nr:type I toxin-antitoxin system antitoxin YafN [Amphritea atlantica]SEQ01786.1 antitoxin YafN [Amphritea atlantica]